VISIPFWMSFVMTGAISTACDKAEAVLNKMYTEGAEPIRVGSL
jgi:hypothetical protein